MESELRTALNAVSQAAEACRRVQAAIEPASLEKKDKSPVTVADFASQALVCRRLQSEFPDDPVIGEEGAAELRSGEATFLDRVVTACAEAGVSASADAVCDWIDRGGLQEFRPRFWTLDPIDGTKGFLRKEQYAISLALIVDGQIKVGVLGCPNMPVAADESDSPRGILAWAVKGQGAWMRPLDSPSKPPQQLRVTATSTTNEARFCESVESGTQLARLVRCHRRSTRDHTGTFSHRQSMQIPCRLLAEMLTSICDCRHGKDIKRRSGTTPAEC